MRPGLPVTAHAHSLPAVEQAIQVGVDGMEHCSCLTPTGLVATDEVLDGGWFCQAIVVDVVGAYRTSPPADRRLTPARDSPPRTVTAPTLEPWRRTTRSGHLT